MKKLSLKEILEGIEDTRRSNSVMYPLHEVLFIMLVAIICGATSYARIEFFGHSRKEWFEKYLKLENGIPDANTVHAEYKAKRINNGLGGIVLEEVSVEPYVKDLSIYERAAEYEKEFDITNWRFYMAFDDDIPVGAMTVVGKTDGLNMLYGRNDACVLWDIRVADAYKRKGIGQKLMYIGILNAKKDGYQQMIIECQNNNVPACKFYQKQGAVLSKIDMYAYYLEPEVRNEIQFIWYLDI